MSEQARSVRYWQEVARGCEKVLVALETDLGPRELVTEFKILLREPPSAEDMENHNDKT
jgi:hypothetical protein